MEEVLYAPWRSDYVTHEKIEGCVFCHISRHPDLDEQHHVLFRNEHFFVVMNKYPYTPGHFMMIPHMHTDKLEALDPVIWMKMSAQVQKGVQLLKEVVHAHGVNIGMNLGEAGGAGIAEHIHFHFVPRWQRDTNFMTSVAQTRVHSTDFEKIYQMLKENQQFGE
jgi:diadenosine tetraphosphate (Ap4A) HIT family hydrolase